MIKKKFSYFSQRLVQNSTRRDSECRWGKSTAKTSDDHKVSYNGGNLTFWRLPRAAWFQYAFSSERKKTNMDITLSTVYDMSMWKITMKWQLQLSSWKWMELCVDEFQWWEKFSRFFFWFNFSIYYKNLIKF